MAKDVKIGALRIDIGASTAQLEAGLKKAQGSLAAFAKGAGAAGALAGAALAAVGTAVAVGMKQAIDRAEQLGETAQKIGVPVEELSRLEHAASMSGVALEGLGSGLKRLSANMMEAAASADGKAAKAFKALGVSVTDADGKLRSNSAVMQDVAGRFAAMQDGAGKTALAMAIFGKSGADLIPMLNEGKEGMAALMAEADALGMTIDEKTARAADAFNDNLQKLGLVQSGISTQIAAQLAPAMAALSGEMVALASNTELVRSFGQGLAITLKVMVSAAVVAGEAIVAVAKSAAGAVEALWWVRRGDFGKALEALNRKAFDGQAVWDRLGRIWSATGEQAELTAGRVRAAAPVIEASGAKVKKTLSEQEKAHRKAKETADRYIESLQEEVETFGWAADQVKDKEALARASEALAAGLTHEAAAILRLADARRRLAAEAVSEKVEPWNPGELTTIGSPEFMSGLDMTIDALGQALQASDALAFSIEGAFHGLKNNDWMGAAMNIVRAFQQVRAEGMSLGSVLGSIGVAAGNLIGGTVGAGISGAASGAMTGFMFGGPVGAVVGGILGGLGGIFGASKAKKAAKKRAREQARLEAERKAAELAAARRDLEWRLMELQGKSAEVLAARRKAELEAMDASLRALQEQVWAAEDAAAAEQKLAQERALLRDLQAQLMEATGDAAGALKMLREDQLAALPEALRPVQEALWRVLDANEALAAAEAQRAEILEAAETEVEDARDRLAESYEREAAGIEDTIARSEGLAETLADLRGELEAGARAAGDPRLAARLARREFDAVSAAAASGDAAAMERLPEVIRAFLAAEEAIAPDARSVQRARAQALAAVKAAEASARGQVSAAQAQLAALKESVAGLLQLNESVLSVREAIAGVNQAIQVAAGAEAAANALLAQQVTAAAQAAAQAAASAAAAVAPAVAAAESAQTQIAELQTSLETLLAPVVVNTRRAADVLTDASDGAQPLQTQAAA